MLLHQELQLAAELGLLLLIRENGHGSAVVKGLALQRPKRRHVLNDKKADLVAGLVKQGWFNFDLPQVSGWLRSFNRGHLHVSEPY